MICMALMDPKLEASTTLIFQMQIAFSKTSSPVLDLMMPMINSSLAAFLEGVKMEEEALALAKWVRCLMMISLKDSAVEAWEAFSHFPPQTSEMLPAFLSQ